MLPVNILVMADTIAALSARTLADNVHLTDDGWESRDKGTRQLETVCVRGQLISWRAVAIDVQSPVLIAGIEFLPCDAAPVFASGIDPRPDRYVVPRWRTWALTVPCAAPRGLYRYRIALQMGAGPRSVMFIDSPALDVVA